MKWRLYDARDVRGLVVDGQEQRPERRYKKSSEGDER